MNQPLISVSGLCKQFDELKAVDNLSFSVFSGDIYGFLGQNGAGKSTTIRMLLTLIQPTGGTIEMFGYKLPGHRTEILRQVGAIIERPDLYKFLSAYDNLDMFARLSGVKPTKSQIMDQLERVGLAQRAHSKVKTYSQGMKQRLGIAISLIHDPQLIILDEPTNGLDPQGIADMRKMILDLRSEHKKTVIVSSHLLNEIEQVATRMIIIHKGRKIVEGTTTELFDPADTLVEVHTPEQRMIEKLANSPWQNKYEQQEDKWVFRLHASEVPTLAKDLVARDIPLDNFSRVHSLEHLFLKLTSEAALNTD
jgi:ABC-type multidrug transport system ATPase subunit